MLHTSVTTDAPPVPAVTALALAAGQGEREDAAIAGVVAEVGHAAVTRYGAERWWFLRRPGARQGSVVVCTRGGHAAAVGAGLARAGTVTAVPWVPRPEPWGGPDGLELAERFFASCSAITADVLPALTAGSDRAGYALATAHALVASGTAPARRRSLWRALAAHRLGEEGAALLARLDQRAAGLRPGFEAAAALAADGPAATALARYARAAAAMVAAAAENGHGLEAVCLAHVHATWNRLGLSPLEEALLATVLAHGADDASSASPRRGRAGGVAEPPVDESAAKPATGVAPNGPVVALRNVSKDDGGTDGGLDGVSLQVESGEVFGLLGRASGGPSSLLGIAAGLRLASGGRVRTLGREPALARSEIAEDIGVFDGDEELAGQLTVRETLELRLPRAAARVSADGVLERAGLFDDSARRVEELDAGGLRRLQLARALATDPAVAFLDDPTRDLDPSERDDVLAIVRRLREAGRTVVLATSSVFDVCAVCDRAALVLAGSVTAVDAPDALVREHFPRRSVHFETEREFDPGLLDEMPEVLSLSVEPRESAPGSAIAVETYQPDALMRLIGADVTLPRVVHLRAEDVADPFGAPAGPSAPEPSEQRGGR